MSRRKGTRVVGLKFEEAKRQYPFAMQRLLLLVKQETTLRLKKGRLSMPRMSDDEMRGLCALGVLRLEVGQGGAKLWLVEPAVEMIRRTTLNELQQFIEEQRQALTNTQPASGIRQRGPQAFHRRRAV